MSFWIPLVVLGLGRIAFFCGLLVLTMQLAEGRLLITSGR